MTIGYHIELDELQFVEETQEPLERVQPLLHTVQIVLLVQERQLLGHPQRLVDKTTYPGKQVKQVVELEQVMQEEGHC